MASPSPPVEPRSFSGDSAFKAQEYCRAVTDKLEQILRVNGTTRHAFPIKQQLDVLGSGLPQQAETGRWQDLIAGPLAQFIRAELLQWACHVSHDQKQFSLRMSQVLGLLATDDMDAGPLSIVGFAQACHEAHLATHQDLLPVAEMYVPVDPADPYGELVKRHRRMTPADAAASAAYDHLSVAMRLQFAVPSAADMQRLQNAMDGLVFCDEVKAAHRQLQRTSPIRVAEDRHPGAIGIWRVAFLTTYGKPTTSEKAQWEKVHHKSGENLMTFSDRFKRLHDLQPHVPALPQGHHGRLHEGPARHPPQASRAGCYRHGQPAGS
jgi:hypothetical protein